MNNTTDLETLSTLELKAFVYDHTALANFHGNQVRMANIVLEKRAQEEIKEENLTVAKKAQVQGEGSTD